MKKKAISTTISVIAIGAIALADEVVATTVEVVAVKAVKEVEVGAAIAVTIVAINKLQRAKGKTAQMLAVTQAVQAAQVIQAAQTAQAISHLLANRKNQIDQNGQDHLKVDEVVVIAINAATNAINLKIANNHLAT